jgi:hypothetical protein
MALLNGQTPEQIAAEIIEKMQKPVLIEISGIANQNLEQVLRYKYAKKIYSKGDKWFAANLESLRTEFLESIIEAQYDQRKKADEKAAEAEKWEYVTLLISRGLTRYKALEMAGLLSKEDVEAQEKLDAAEKAKKEQASKK